MTTFDAESGEVLPPMDTYITEMEAGDKELNLVRKEMDENKKGSTNTKENTRSNPMFLQQQLQIHDDDTVSTFWDGKQDDDTIGRKYQRKWAPRSPSEVTPSTLLQTMVTSLSLSRSVRTA